LDDLAAAENQRQDSVTKGTHNKKERVWRRWKEYCQAIENNHHVNLQSLEPQYRTSLFEAFAAALHRQRFSRPDKKHLGLSTVSEAVANLGQIFRANMGFNPCHDTGSTALSPSLARQFKGMKTPGPAVVPQRALPVLVYRTMHEQAKSSHLNAIIAAIGWLHKANVDEQKQKHLQATACYFATLLIKAECCLYSQLEKDNNVVDALNHRFDLSNPDLINYISQKYPS
jgi:hypothetical protein